MVAAEEIRQNPEALARVSASLRRRVETCIRENGGHFEHLLWFLFIYLFDQNN
jgi:hypothetical protein